MRSIEQDSDTWLKAPLETLRTQSRFHDPDSDSIFSWSDTTERYRAVGTLTRTLTYFLTLQTQWTEAYSKPSSRTPSRPASPILSKAHSKAADSALSLSPHLQQFYPPVKVLSSSVKGTFTKNAIKQSIDEDGQLELLLPTMITPMTGRRRTRFAVLEYEPVG